MPTPQPTSKTPSTMIGGPGIEEGQEVIEETDPDLEAASGDEGEDPADDSDPVYEINGKVFASAQEMSSYVANLEVAAARSHQATLPSSLPDPSTARPMIDGRPLTEVMFENPEKFVEHVTATAVGAIDNRKAAEVKKQALWDSFHQKYPDLKGKDVLTNAILVQNLQKWNHLPEDQAMKMLAKETRLELKKMGIRSEKVTEMPSGESATIGSTRSATPPKKVEPKPVLSFTEQMKALRNKQRNSN